MQAHADASALLAASGLPTRWAGQTAWTVLDTHFDAGQRFLATWRAWRNDPQRPAMLHYVGYLTADGYSQTFATTPSLDAAPPGEADLQQALQHAAADRAPGIHRLLLDRGQVSLTLCIGDNRAFLGDHRLHAHTVWLDAHNLAWDKWTAKAVARLCMRDATLIAHLPGGPHPEWLKEAGFMDVRTGEEDSSVVARFNPGWSLGAKEPPAANLRTSPARHCCVVGAGISGASVAHAMARRGWRVTVLDAAQLVAAGASGLPVGLVVPHISADDSPRSRLSRVGARLMLQHASDLLTRGVDWDLSGVHEHRFTDGPDHRHAQAGWIQPTALVKAWLNHDLIAVRYGAEVHSLQRTDTDWSLQNAARTELSRADVVIFANAYNARALLGSDAMAAHRAPTLPLTLNDLQAVHGTATLGRFPDGVELGADSTGPHNGHGCFIPVPSPGAPGWWLAGSTFEPDAEPTPSTLRDHRLASLVSQHAANLERLQQLLPSVGRALADQFQGDSAQSWSGTRCVTHDRLPLAGPVDAEGSNGLWMHVGMGARGLTFSALGAEWIAARIEGEPWPVESSIARTLDAQRLRKRRALREVECDST
jgi:tRNA 5-methylaminomethyl-2-thiouridine biosynthesis bifunctional protein